MKKFMLSSLALIMASQTYAATTNDTTASTATTKKTTATKPAITKPTAQPTIEHKATKPAVTKLATSKADDKKVKTGKTETSKNNSKTTTNAKPSSTKPTTTKSTPPSSSETSKPNNTAPTNTSKVTAPRTTTAKAAAIAAPVIATTAATSAINNNVTDSQTGLDNDYTDGAGVAGENSEVNSSSTRQLTTLDPTTIGTINAANTPTLSNLNLSQYAQLVNNANWQPNQNVNSATTIKLQALLDWNHASPGPIDGGWGMNAKKALKNFQAMNNLPVDGHMNQAVWDLLNKNIPQNQPVLMGYTITEQDVKGPYAPTPSGSEAKSKMKGLYYENIQEMLAERFHMDIRYLKKLNADKDFNVGDTITVFNPGKPLDEKITRIVAKKADNTLYAYNSDKLIAAYPTTVGSADTPSPTGSFTIVNRVKNPWYRASSGEGKDKKVFMLPPGPNGPVGVVWMGLNKPSYGIHGSPVPEGISRQASHGCVRLTNWDVLEVYANTDNGTKVELQ